MSTHDDETTGRITSATYWTEVEDIAIAATLAGLRTEQDPHDYVTDTVTGHQWVIYPAFSFDVLRWSQNEDAGTEDSDFLLSEWSTMALLSFLAGHAFERDVLSHSAFNRAPTCPECGDPVEATQAGVRCIDFDDCGWTGALSDCD